MNYVLVLKRCARAAAGESVLAVNRAHEALCVARTGARVRESGSNVDFAKESINKSTKVQDGAITECISEH